MNVQGAILPEDVVESCSKELVESVDVECAQHVATLGPIYDSIVAELEPQLRCALQDWRKMYERIVNLREQTRQSEAAVKEMEDWLDKLAPTWEKFVSAIMDLHLDLCRRRQGLWAKFSTAWQDFAARKAQVEATFNRGLQRISQVRDEIRVALEDLARSSKELEQQRAEVQQIHAQFSIQWQALRRELEGLEGDLDNRMGNAEQVFSGLDRYLREQEKVVRDFDDLREKLAKLAKEKRQLEAKLSELQSRAEEIRAREQKGRTEIEKLKTTLGQLKKTIVDEDAAARLAQLQVQGLTAQVQNLNKYLKRLRAAAKRAVPQAKTFVAVVQSLVESLQTRPSWHQALRAGWLFARALVLVPYGFYPSEFTKSAGNKVGRDTGGGKRGQRGGEGGFPPPDVAQKPVKPHFPVGSLQENAAREDRNRSSDFPARMEENVDIGSHEDAEAGTGSEGAQELSL
jgi:prefoldin subunit 5